MLAPLTRTLASCCEWFPLARGTILALCLGSAVTLKTAEPTESEIQAAYLFNFAKFVQWPASALPERNTPVVIGLIDRDHFAQTVSSVIGTNRVNSHHVEVRLINPAEPRLDGCHLLFLSRTQSELVERMLEQSNRKPILTVSDADRFASDGGMIGFVKAGGSVKFEVNLSKATEAGLKISSKLLSLAKIVKSEPGKERK